MPVLDLTPQLGPVAQTHRHDQLESQVIDMMMEIFRANLRDEERSLNANAMPHLASVSMIEMWIMADGLGVIKGGHRDHLRYLFKAWRSRNPKRGLHFLRTYLQMIWPNGWTATQMWQQKDAPYPAALVSPLTPAEIEAIRPTHFLTSRINVSVIDDEEDGTGLIEATKSIRAALGARYFVKLSTARSSKMTINIAAIGTPFHLLVATGQLA